MKICGKCRKLYQQVIMRMQSGRSLKLLWKESSSEGTENTLAVNADEWHHSYVLEVMDDAWRIMKSGLHTVMISKSYLQDMYHDPLNIGCSSCVIFLKKHWELITQTTAILLPFIFSCWNQSTKLQFNHNFFGIYGLTNTALKSVYIPYMKNIGLNIVAS